MKPAYEFARQMLTQPSKQNTLPSRPRSHVLEDESKTFIHNGVRNQFTEQGPKRSSSERALAKAYDYQGQVAGGNKDYETANVLLMRSLRLAQQEKQLEMEAVILHNLGTIADFQKDPRSARKFFSRSLSIKRKCRASPSRMGMSTVALATIDRKERRFSDSESRLRATLDFATKAGDRRLLAFYLQEKARLDTMQGGSTALQFAEEALSIWKSLASARDIDETERLIYLIRNGEAVDD